MKFAGIGKRDGDDGMDTAMVYAGLGKRNNVETRGMNLAMHYAGLGKRSFHNDGEWDTLSEDPDDISVSNIVKRASVRAAQDVHNDAISD